VCVCVCVMLAVRGVHVCERHVRHVVRTAVDVFVVSGCAVNWKEQLKTIGSLQILFTYVSQ
jgi:hypothetical protein